MATIKNEPSLDLHEFFSECPHCKSGIIRQVYLRGSEGVKSNKSESCPECFKSI